MPNPILRRRAISRKSSGLRPDQVAGLQGWWDASRLELADGAACSTLANQQGAAGRDCSTSSTARPIFRTGVKHGLGALEFDGVNDVMTAAGTPSNYLTADNATILAVCRPATLTLNNSTPYGNHPIAAGSTDYFGIYARNSTPATIVGYTWLTGSRSVAAEFNGAGEWIVVAFRLISGATIKISVNGGAEASASSEGINAGSGLSGELRLGAGGSNFFPGFIGEAAVWSLAVSDSETAFLVAGLKAKWGIL